MIHSRNILIGIVMYIDPFSILEKIIYTMYVHIYILYPMFSCTICLVLNKLLTYPKSHNDVHVTLNEMMVF